ncbi:ankyrin repeat domain-containing protein [Candidatus Dependentiae bacterium]|nr:ankyrin repeat domain-containing protein [Candidatus Dependentiae bacterium]
MNIKKCLVIFSLFIYADTLGVKINFNIQINQLNMLLLESTAYGLVEETKEILSKGAHIQTQSEENGNTPLHNAIQHGTPELINLLLEYNANPLAKNHQNETPLDKAVINNKQNLVTLLELYIQVRHEAITQPSQDTLLKAVHFGWPYIVEYLLAETNAINLSKKEATLYIKMAEAQYKKTRSKAYKNIKQNIKSYQINRHPLTLALDKILPIILS